MLFKAHWDGERELCNALWCRWVNLSRWARVSNTMSLMHAGPVETTEWPSLDQQRGNTNKHHQRTCCLSELAGYKACRCVPTNKDTFTIHSFIHTCCSQKMDWMKTNYRSSWLIKLVEDVKAWTEIGGVVMITSIAFSLNVSTSKGLLFTSSTHVETQFFTAEGKDKSYM